LKADEYQDVAAAEKKTLNRLMASRGGPGRLPALSKTFFQATLLETAFWDMGLNV